MEKWLHCLTILLPLFQKKKLEQNKEYQVTLHLSKIKDVPSNLKRFQLYYKNHKARFYGKVQMICNPTVKIINI